MSNSRERVMKERRAGLSLEERQVEALEAIADRLPRLSIDIQELTAAIQSSKNPSFGG